MTKKEETMEIEEEIKLENKDQTETSSKEEKPSGKTESPKEKEPTEAEIIDYKDKYLRTLAEIENLRKRLQKEKQETLRFVLENTISEFLPVLDNFENALRFASSSSEEIQKWSAGFKMILTQFRDVLYSHDIVTFHSEGNHFDPYYHEAMEIVETNQHPDGLILEEFAKGYKSENRVIRAAKVKVAKKPAQKDSNLKNNQG